MCNTVLPLIYQIKNMAAKKADEQKKVYTYRARPSIVKKANAKAKKDKTTLSNKIENLIYEYSN